MEMNYNDAELHEIEQELHTEIIPGTEIMTDVGAHHFVKSQAGVLVPQPSDDPHDPLNWSSKWKTLAMIAASSVTFTQGFGPLSIAASIPAYIVEFDSNLEAVLQFTGVAILVLGFSNFIWVPLSSSFGRRFVYITSQIICIASLIWRAKATTYSSFMGASILNGIGAGPAESIQPAVIADIFFLHDRGFWNTVYWTSYMGSLMVAPIISGSMSATVGIKPFWWLNVAMQAVSILLVVFCFPETRWHRPHPDEIASHAAASKVSPSHSNEKVAGIEAQEQSDLSQTRTNATMQDLSHIDTAARDPHLGKGTPSKKQWMIVHPNTREGVFKSLLLDFWMPWKLLAFPIVLFASFVVSWSCSSFLTLNLTQSQNFAAPPYNFSSTSVGFTNFAVLVGALIGLPTAGWLSDWVAKRQTLRNRGIREPEMRLLAMIPFVIIMYLGNVIVSVGYQQKWHWAPIVIIGYTCAGIQVAALPAIVSTYAVDSYKPVAGSLFVAITVNKNVWGYGLSKFITPWIVEAGYIKPIMTNASLILLWCLCGVIFYMFGKTFRRWTAHSSVHRM